MRDLRNADVTGVLLPDGWHDVINGSYEARRGDEENEDYLFSFVTYDDRKGPGVITGPLSSVLARRGEIKR
jgi:hypothetical protein